MKVNHFLKLFFVISLGFTNTSCMLTYLAKSGISQMKILTSREKIDKVLNQSEISEKTREKLLLVKKVRDFCFNDLKLKKTKNYSSFVQLDDRYVSYLLRVAPKYELKSYKWSFPIVGTFPYLGFFDKQDALDEQTKFKNDNYDTYVRGVTAFSSLGWFNDPVLSSMMNYENHDLVNLIIHETVHSTLFIKDNVSFNERLATFLANIGTKMYYQKIEGNDSNTIQLVNQEQIDDKLFSAFITDELKHLKKWYKETDNVTDELKTNRLQLITDNFDTVLKPKLKTKKYFYFSKKELNNANLLPYQTYLSDLSDFEKVHTILGSDFHKTLDYLKTLEDEKDAIKALKTKANN